MLEVLEKQKRTLVCGGEAGSDGQEGSMEEVAPHLGIKVWVRLHKHGWKGKSLDRVRKGTEVADASDRGPLIIHIQYEPVGTTAEKARKVDSRGPKACRKTLEFGVYLVGRGNYRRLLCQGV